MTHVISTSIDGTEAQSYLRSQDDLINRLILKSQAVTFEDLECGSPWLDGNNPGASAAPGVNFRPSPNSPAGFTLMSKPGGGYQNHYWYKQLGADASRVSFRQEAQFMFPTAVSVGACQAVEFDLQQCISGQVFNWGYQFDYAEGKLRQWNRSKGDWEPSGVSIVRPMSGVWTKVSWLFHRDESNVYYDGATVNGISVTIPTVSFPAPKLGLPDMLNYGFQIDGNQSSLPVTVLVTGMRLWAGKV